MKDRLSNESGNQYEVEWSDPVGSDVYAIDHDGLVIAGRYMGAKEVSGKHGATTIHTLVLATIEHSAGTPLADVQLLAPLQFWGSAVLDDLLHSVRPTTLVRIEFLRRKGDRGLKLWDVRVPLRVVQKT